MGKQTPLYQAHLAQKARMVDFAGWDMPVQYTSIMDEHKTVRSDAGMFDVSHMLAIDITGSDAKAFLQKLLANDVAKLKTPGKALYSCMLNLDGFVIDDLITYFVSDGYYRMVVNAGTREKDFAWMQSQIGDLDVSLNQREEFAIIAIQGPKAPEKAALAMPAELATKVKSLKRFFSCEDNNWFVGRTGYTGEDGFEVILPSDDAPAFWDKLLDVGVKPIGLGARDTLRLEAGMNLYGSDMDETTHPFNSGLKWTVSFEPQSRDFNGRRALDAIDQSSTEKLVGLVLQDRGVLRNGLKVFQNDQEVGEITSGSFSPTTAKAIAFARVDQSAASPVEIEIRGKRMLADIVSVPFVKQGKATF